MLNFDDASCPTSSFQLQTVENLIEKADQYVFVRASLCHGTEALPKQELITTKKMPLKNTIDWNEKLEFIVQMKYLPKVHMRYLQFNLSIYLSIYLSFFYGVLFS